MARISRDGTVLRPVQLMLPADLFRRLECEKNRRGRGESLTGILLEWLRPKLEELPSDPRPGRIES